MEGYDLCFFSVHGSGSPGAPIFDRELFPLDHACQLDHGLEFALMTLSMLTL